MIPAEKIIELKELRIGNILSYKGNYVHVTLISIDADDEYEDTIGFCQMGTNSGEKIDWNRVLAGGLDRIPLTPEILEKCGFKRMLFKHEMGGRLEPMLQHNEYDYLYYAPERRRDKVNLLGGRLNITALVYLHELQNLFYCLTGQELEVRL